MIGAPLPLSRPQKTAVIMSGFYPAAVWLAIGSLSYLNAKRLAYVKERQIILYPDLGAFEKWRTKAEDMAADGFDIATSDLLELNATETDRAAGLDLADYFIRQAITPQPAQDRTEPAEPTEHITNAPQAAQGPEKTLPPGFAYIGPTLEYQGLPVCWLNPAELAQAVEAAPHLALEILSASNPAVAMLADRFGLELAA
jgi:hypothetical protein